MGYGRTGVDRYGPPAPSTAVNDQRLPFAADRPRRRPRYTGAMPDGLDFVPTNNYPADGEQARGAVTLEGTWIVLTFSHKHHPFINAVKSIKGAHEMPRPQFDSRRRSWLVHIGNIRQVRDLAHRHGWEMSDAVRNIPDLDPGDVPMMVSAEGEQLILIGAYREETWEILSEGGASYERHTGRWFIPYELALDIIFDLQKVGRIKFVGDRSELMDKLDEAAEMLRLSRALKNTTSFEVADTVQRELRAFQVPGVEYLTRAGRGFGWATTGSGKTTVAAVALEQLDAFPALIIPPSGLKTNWVREAYAILPHRQVFVCEGQLSPERAKDLTRLLALHDHKRLDRGEQREDRRGGLDVPPVLDEPGRLPESARLPGVAQPAPSEQPVDERLVRPVDHDSVPLHVDGTFPVDDPSEVGQIGHGGRAEVDRRGNPVLPGVWDASVSPSGSQGHLGDAEPGGDRLPSFAVEECPVCLQHPGLGDLTKLAHAEILICNYDILAFWRDFLIGFGLAAVVADEGHRLSNPRSRWTKAAIKISESLPHQAPRFILTATPVRNRRSELVPQLAFIGREGEFGDRKQLREDERLARRMRTVCAWRPDPKEVLQSLGVVSADGSIDPIEDRVLIDGDPKAMAEYRHAEANILEYLMAQARKKAIEIGEDPESAAVEAAMKLDKAKHLMVVNTLVSAANKAKIGPAVEWARDFKSSGDKILAFAERVQMMEAMAEATGWSLIRGGVSKKRRTEIEDQFQGRATGDLQGIVIQYQSGGEGLTLTEAWHVLHAELRWSPGDHIQADGRAWYRMNDPHNITAHYLICAGTIDELRMDVLDGKRAEMATVTDGDRMSIANSDTFGDVLSILLRRALGN